MTFNYQEALKNAALSMVRVKSPTHLIKMIARFLDREMGISHTSIIVLDGQKHQYVFCDSQGEKKVPKGLIKLEKDNPLIRWFSSKKEANGLIKKDHLSLQYLNSLLQDKAVLSYDKTLENRLVKIKEYMDTLKATLCVPGFYKGELLGIFILGEKTDMTEFNQEEMSFFQTLASDASMTIKNAEYKDNLLQKIEELEQSLDEIKRLRENDKDKYLQTILTFAYMVDARDPYTYGHSEQIKKLGLLTAHELHLDLSGEKEKILTSALLLHDVGKLGVPDNILHKKGPLTNDEWVLMREHVRTGPRILENHDDFKEVSVIIMHHHENFDGTGYPYKLKGDEIPIQSRIICVVDAFDAMVSDRPYRKGLAYDHAIAELKKCSGTQFDPKVVDAFLKIIEREINV
ncbi:MAG: HD domain-containing protein [Candidatus Omnitrophica bacterium]|nr:HD domain-containing protein [Candidatus Omnitrophota bacterium]